MTTSFHYQSPRVEEDAAFLDLNPPNVAVDDFSCMPQFATYPAADCDSIVLSKLDDFPLDSSLWDNFNPDSFASTEPSNPLYTAALNDIWSTDFNSLPDLSSICFDTPQMGHVSPNLFSPDTTFSESALPSSPDSDDPNQRLNWVKSTLKDLALARAAKDTRPVSQRTKQMDASIELYLQLQNDISSGFQEDCNFAAQSMVLQHSSTTLSDSSFDTNYFSVTGSPGSSTGTVPELSPASMTRAGSVSAGSSRTAVPPATGGVEMVLDMNLNETTSLPRKRRPKTIEERQRYIAVRRQGACEWHRKQRKRCTCVDKKETAITTVKRKKLMKNVQSPSQHCSGALLPLSGGDRWRRTNVRPSSGPLECSSALEGGLVPEITLQCRGDRPCNDPHCLQCCCGSAKPTTPPLPVLAQSRSVRQVHKPIINCGTLQLIERKSPIGPTDCDPGHVLQSPPPDLLQSRTETQAPFPSRQQNAVGLPGSVRPVQDLHIHIIASPGRPSSSLDPQLSSGNTGDTPIWHMPEHSGVRMPSHRRVDAAVSAPAGAGDRPPNSRLNVVPEPSTIHVNVETVFTDGQSRVTSRATSRSQTDNSSMGITSLTVDRVVRLILRTILRLSTQSSPLLPPSTNSSGQCYHSPLPEAARNRLSWAGPRKFLAFATNVQGGLSPTREQCGAKVLVTPTSIALEQAAVTNDKQQCIPSLGRRLEAKQSNRPLSKNMPSNFHAIARTSAYANSAVVCPDALMALAFSRRRFLSHHDYPEPTKPNSAASSSGQWSEHR
ncbi:hypothetical protein ACJ73_00235 [Blastomyces percursus]|uniref:Uncharacterized protein n=1 Tax=Blastomyces percursus TaxID=1658174 RepID=A0A1J9RK67_9EURO|nr:hypothetical protein ACJ73_00235 [Blastomyces percursus]